MSDITLKEKYERNGWPAVARPDLKPPEGWEPTAAHLRGPARRA